MPTAIKVLWGASLGLVAATIIGWFLPIVSWDVTPLVRR